MLFTEPSFLFYFLPVLLALHFVAPRGARNALLLVASLLFYAWGEPVFVLGLLLSIAFNFAVGRAIDAAGGSAAGRLTAFGIAGNLALLGWFKYAAFVASNVNATLALIELPPLPLPAAGLPIGVSFFSFQAISYLVDVKRGEARAQRNPLDAALYIAMFPQLIAGPIVRYADIEAQLRDRRVSLEGFAIGVRRFVTGLAKKLLVANTLAWPADELFALAESGAASNDVLALTSATAWLAVACFSFQIYFDFSGYSDMAIGLARMFGFRYRENFDYPYTARSVTEFWRRWHISLSSWFRDYLYIPLGGNRGGAFRVARNLWTVFLLVGLWHGAAWSFVVWGTYHGLFLVLERSLPISRLPGGAAPLRRIATLAIIAIGWVFFRADTLAGAAAMLSALVGGGGGDARIFGLAHILDARVGLALAAAAIGSTRLPAHLAKRLLARLGRPIAAAALEFLWFTGLLVACATVIAAGSYDPFLYFRF